MVKVVYIEFNGTEHTVDVPSGYSVMEGAVKNGVPGIVADCGGACACATCHVYVDPAWAAKIEPVSELEAGMLEFVGSLKETSRLSCQIAVNDELNGLIVHTPASQT